MSETSRVVTVADEEARKKLQRVRDEAQLRDLRNAKTSTNDEARDVLKKFDETNPKIKVED